MNDEVNQETIRRQGGVIRLRPGVAAGLAQLSRLLKPAIEYVWVDMVWRKNHDRYKEVLDVKGSATAVPCEASTTATPT
jgi:hypothetical protein